MQMYNFQTIGKIGKCKVQIELICEFAEGFKVIDDTTIYFMN